MKNMLLGSTDLEVSRIAYGCMGFAARKGEPDQAAALKRDAAVLDRALANGITLFDHADIYSGGLCEENFGRILASRPGLRDTIAIQTKCSVRWGDPASGTPNRFDMTPEHVASSVEGSLRRLRTDRIDVLLVHHPDPLMEEEVTRAFEKLHESGKVRHFGVSNFTPLQIDLLASWWNRPIAADQVQMNCSTPDYFEAKPGRVTNTHGLLEYSRLRRITLQAWSPLAQGRFLVEEPAEPLRNLARTVKEIAGRRGVPAETVAIAWLLRHPAGIQPVIGTLNPERVDAACRAVDLEMTREEWYAIINAMTGRVLL